MTDEPLETETEAGLPGKQGEFPISLPWIARFAFTAVIGAVVGFAASTVFPTLRFGPSGAWLVAASGAIAATPLSIRKIHGWHISTFADGTLAGLAAWPIFFILALGQTTFRASAAPSLEGLGWALLVAVFGNFFTCLVTVPCGWLAGALYHVVVTAAERSRQRQLS